MNFGKYKLLAHIVLGLLALIPSHYFFKWLIQDNLFWLPVCIVVVIVSAIAEKTQQITKTGTATAYGMARTCLALVPYIIYQVITMLIKI